MWFIYNKKNHSESGRFWISLTNNTYRLHKKLIDAPLKININSNHPAGVEKQILRSSSRWISNTSLNKTVFEKNIEIFEDVLRPLSFNESLQYLDKESNNPNTQEHQKCKKKVICLSHRISWALNQMLVRYFWTCVFYEIFNKKCRQIKA